MPWLNELLPSVNKETDGEAFQPPLGPTGCRTCGGTGYVPDDAAWEASGFQRCPVMPCPACGAEQRARLLAKLDGMDEEQRRWTFANFSPGPNQEALNACRWAARAKRGMIVLWGSYGRGKTHLLSAVINRCREQSMLAAYVTHPAMMDRIRAGIDTHTDVLQRYIDIPALALDELGRAQLTEWGQDRFFQIIDRRWLAVRRQLTVVASNDSPEEWPGYLKSRFSDGRCRVIKMVGPDNRPTLSWDSNQG